MSEVTSNSDENITSTSDLPEVNMRGYWQPKQKRSLAERLPPNTLYLIPPNRYIFPGAEYFIDSDEKYDYFDNSSLDSSDSESETTENDTVDNFF